MKPYINTVSLLIPCYNRADHITRVVEAGLDQTRPPDEVIVVDDKSTDNSVDVLEKLPVHLVCHQRNQGPAIARNTALQAAQGDIVVYVDADAYADHGMIEALLEAYKHPDSASLAGVTGRGIESNINSLWDRWRSLHARQDFGESPRDKVDYPIGLCMSFRREVLLEVGGFDPFYPINAGEDYDLGFRLHNAGYWLRYTPDAIVYHQHSDTEEGLKRVQYHWYYWSYLARQRTNAQPGRLIIGTLRRLLTETLSDLVIRRDPGLARLDVEIFLIKLRAIWDAIRRPTG
jgi:GT2 family glycosyltransferase